MKESKSKNAELILKRTKEEEDTLVILVIKTYSQYVFIEHKPLWCQFRKEHLDQKKKGFLKQTSKPKLCRPYICGIPLHERSVITCSMSNYMINDVRTTVYPNVRKRYTHILFHLMKVIRSYHFLKNIKSIFIALHFIYIKYIWLYIQLYY